MLNCSAETSCFMPVHVYSVELLEFLEPAYLDTCMCCTTLTLIDALDQSSLFARLWLPPKPLISGLLDRLLYIAFAASCCHPFNAIHVERETN